MKKIMGFVVILLLHAGICVSNEIVPMKFFVGKWYSKPEFEKFFQAERFDQIELSPDGKMLFRYFAIVKDEDKTATSSAVKILEKFGSCRFSNGEVEGQMTDKDEKFLLKRVDDYAIIIDYNQEASPPRAFVRESQAPWSKLKTR